MEKGSILRLQIPYSEKPGKYFKFRLKTELYNEQAEYDAPPRMLFLSDIEGNFLALQRILINNRVINKFHEWTFEDGHLIIAGDCFDRGEQVIECLWLIYSLEEKARVAGGHVHFILGNHEIMNLNGDWRYIHPKYAIPDTEGKGITALYNGNNTLRDWLLTKNIIEKIGDILVVHGGISPAMNRFTYSVNQINGLARPYYASAAQKFDEPLLNLLFNSDQSPFWYRGYYNGSMTEDALNETLSHYGVNTIITGHTIVDNVSTWFNGKVINIDTDHAAGKSEALLIKGRRFFKVDSLGKRERIK